MDQRCEDAFNLYQRCISRGVVEYLQKQARVKVRQSIYTAQVVMWLMILQRLPPRGTLLSGVEALLAGAADSLLSRSDARSRSGFRAAPAATATLDSGCRSYYAEK